MQRILPVNNCLFVAARIILDPFPSQIMIFKLFKLILYSDFSSKEMILMGWKMSLAWVDTFSMETSFTSTIEI